jgi:adenylosuccinate lyase
MRCRIWFEIEAHAADTLARGHPKAAQKIWDKGKHATFDVARIDAIEREVKHDVTLFSPTSPRSAQGAPGSISMTSSDVPDTCFNVQLWCAADLLIADVVSSGALRRRLRAQTHADDRRSRHSAEPTTFSVKPPYPIRSSSAQGTAHLRADEVAPRLRGGRHAGADRSPGGRVARDGAAVEPVSTQIFRATATPYFATLGIASSTSGRHGFRHLQRTEVLKPKNSSRVQRASAMPHKRNPVLSENVTGLTYIVRAYVTPALENVVLGTSATFALSVEP